MNQLFELIQEELALAGAVLGYRCRSAVALGIGALIGPLLMQLTPAFVQAPALPGLGQAFGHVIGFVALVLTCKFLFLAARLYLKDGAALLKF